MAAAYTLTLTLRRILKSLDPVNMHFARTILLFLLLTMLFSKCSVFDCEHDQPITQELDQWVPYTSGQEMQFKTLALAEEYLDVKKFERAWKNADTDCTDDIEYIETYISGRSTFDSLQIYVSNNNVRISYGPTLNMTYIEGSPGYSTAASRIEFHESMTIGNQSFSNVIVVSCDDCDDLTEIRLSKTFGIIEFTYGGLVYARVTPN